MIIDTTNIIYVMIGCALASGMGALIAAQFFSITKKQDVVAHEEFTRRRLTGASPSMRKGHRR